MHRLIKKKHIWSSFLLIVLVTATAHGTVYIPSDTSIGTWDDAGRVFTLTTDVSETIEITEDDLTVDGAGYTVTGAGSGFGAYLSSRTAVTIRNLNVEGFSTGICLESSSGSTVANNVARNNGSYGILL